MATTKIRLDTQAQDGTLTNAKVATNAGIEISKLEAITSGYVIVGDGSGGPAAVAMGGDTTIESDGTVSIAAGVIVNADINASAAIATSKLADGAEFIQRDGSVAFTANQSMGSNKITNLSDPTADQDAATKSYVDNVAAGLDPKDSVRASTTAALPSGTYSNGTGGVGATITGAANGALAAQDGITLVASDRLLVKNQDFKIQNGLYQLSTVGDVSNPYVLTRVTDADTGTELNGGAFVFVEEGTTNADTGWVCTTDGTVTIGTTEIDFTQFSGVGTVTGGAGIDQTGNTLFITAADASLTVGADTLAVAVDGTAATISVGGAGLQVADGTAGEILIGKGGGSDTAFTAITGDIGLTSGGVTSIAAGAIVNADVNASAAIDFSKLASLTSGNMLVGNASNVATSVAMSGDATMDNTGAVTLAGNVLKEADIVTREVPTGSINGVNTTFTLANTPVSGTEQMYLNGVLQNEGASNDYTISGATITYGSAPDTGSVLLVSYWK